MTTLTRLTKPQQGNPMAEISQMNPGARIGSYKPRQRGSLKEAIDTSVTEAGGAKRVGEVIGKSKTHVSRFTDDAYPDVWPNLAQFLAIELRTKTRPTMCHLAADLGGVFVPFDVPGASALKGFGEAAAELGDATQKLAHFVEDGTLDPREARAFAGELLEVIPPLVAAYQASVAIAEEGGE